MPNTLDHGKDLSPAVHRKLTDRASVEGNGNNPDAEHVSDECVYSETEVSSKPGRKGVGRVEEMFEMQDLTTTSGYSRQLDTASHYEMEDQESEKEGLTDDYRRSDSTEESFTLYTPEEERLVVATFDRRIALFVALLYMLNFLDRSNIGNAKIAGLSEDLKLNSSQFEWLLKAFYVTYIVFEWMALLYRVIPPHIYITICVASWGLVASLQSIAPSFAMLLILRALLGISEAAFGPGVPFYLSFFYKRDELAFRTGLFISAAPLATSFASSLAWAITKAGSSTPIAPWRLLFLVEGFPSVVVAVFVWYCIPDSPETTRYLSQRLRRVASIRLRNERDVVGLEVEKRGLNWIEIWVTLKDPKCYLTAAMFFGCNVAFSSLPVFLPTIIEEMGYSALTSQALSAPPYLAAFAIVLLTAQLSDRYRTRGLFVIFHSLLATFGYAMMAIAGSQHASAAWRYLGVFPATVGFFSAVTIIISWNINNQDSDSKKGTSMTMLNVIGQLGPLLGVQLYPSRDGPYYVNGMAICAGFMGAVAVLAVCLWSLLAAKNRQAAASYRSANSGDNNEAQSMVDPWLKEGARSRPFEFML
ncbi:hypothetical protein MMC07_004971 [Pseudocyphellaria aurata]|nr:hypothetical protein [Pseudocyphellaria aurata]